MLNSSIYKLFGLLGSKAIFTHSTCLAWVAPTGV